MSAPAAELRRVVSTLLHDVGKYVARTARNVVDRPHVDGPLLGMLLRDLYETHRGTRASARFEVLAAELEALGFQDARIVVARGALEQIDSLEEAARGGDEPAVASVVAAAIEVEDALRGRARDVAGGAYR